MCVGFKAGSGDVHHLLNRTDQPVQYLQIDDRSPGDAVQYPDDDLQDAWVEGRWRFAHKDATPY